MNKWFYLFHTNGMTAEELIDSLNYGTDFILKQQMRPVLLRIPEAHKKTIGLFIWEEMRSVCVDPSTSPPTMFGLPIEHHPTMFAILAEDL